MALFNSEVKAIVGLQNGCPYFVPCQWRAQTYVIMFYWNFNWWIINHPPPPLMWCAFTSWKRTWVQQQQAPVLQSLPRARQVLRDRRRPSHRTCEHIPIPFVYQLCTSCIPRNLVIMWEEAQPESFRPTECLTLAPISLFKLRTNIRPRGVYIDI